MGTWPPGWRVVFAGTPEFAVNSLDALVTAGIHPVAVYTQPDRPAGRGRHLQASPVKARALELGLPVRQPESLRVAPALDELTALAPDLVIVVAYGQILDRRVLALPRLGCINVHASLLPRWRGAAPIQRALLAGDAVTGVAVMRMEASLDTGPVYATRETPIAAGDTGGSLHDRLAQLGAEALVGVLEALAAGRAQAVPQPEAGVTSAPKLSKGEASLDWSHSAVALDRQVRAFNPWPVAQTRMDGEVLRIWQAQAESSGHQRAPGTVLEASAAGILVATGEGALRLLQVQRPGARRIGAADLAHQRDFDGLRFA